MLNDKIYRLNHIAYIKCNLVNLDYLKRRIKEVGLLESSKNLT